MRLIINGTGLGDAILFSPILNKLSETETIAFLCFPHNAPSVKSFFAHNKKIKIVVCQYLTEEIKEKYDIVEFLPFSEAYIQKKYPVYLFERFNMKYEDRYKYCKIADNIRKVKQLTPPLKPYVFIHSDHRTGKIEYNGPLEVYRPEQKFPWYPFTAQFPSILQYAFIILNATEIHCIESSFSNLIECLHEHIKAKCYLYMTKKNSSDFTHLLKTKWIVQ